MKIGYPCLNLSLDCTSSRTFRLANWSEDRFLETTKANLDCLRKTLEFNQKHGLLFFRICSGLVPFASHPVNNLNWRSYFRDDLAEIGQLIKNSGMRVSTHPDQFVLINSLSADVLHNSIRELVYHAEVLESLEQDYSSKIQIHIGGAYGDKAQAAKKFIKEYRNLPEIVKKRLVIENDDRIFTTQDCLAVAQSIGIPVVFDYLHYQVNNGGSGPEAMIGKCVETWGVNDGALIVDYSSQAKDKRRGAHAESLDSNDFLNFYRRTKNFDFDLMLEIKDKEESALKAFGLVQNN